MPSAAVLLARGRVLDAAEVPEAVDLHDADVRTGAFADLVGAPLLDLLREERIGDRRSSGPDEVPHAAAHDRGHPVGARQPPHPDDRLRGRLADAAGPFELIALREISRCARVLAPVGDRADVHVPEVHQVVSQIDEFERFLDVDPGGPECVDRDPRGDGAVRAHRVANGGQRLQPEPRPVLQRPSISVGPLVVEGREELHRKIRVGAVHVDDVETAIPPPGRALCPLALHPRDVHEVHLLGDHVRFEIARELARRDGGEPRLVVRDVRPSVVQLQPCERTVLVRGIRHQAQRAHVVLVPESSRDERRLVGVGGERGVLGADRGPATLGLHASVGRLGPGLLGAEPRAVGHLVEAVPERLRADPHRFEQDLVVRVHRCSLSSPCRLSAGR